MAGRRTRRGNIRCRSAPISALSCAAGVSSSTDLSLERLEHVKPQGACEVARPAALLVDLPHQRAQGQLAGLGKPGELGPKGVLQRDAGRVAADCEGTLAHFATVTAPRRHLNLPCRCHAACVYTAAKNPSRTTNGYPQRRD